ncbi:hypothetical protein ACLOJK_028748, partial [Asimina triloba]
NPVGTTRLHHTHVQAHDIHRTPHYVNPSKQAELAKGGDSSPMGSTRGSSASVITEYLQSDAYRRRTEYEYSHHAHGGYTKALLDVYILYP